MKKRTRIVAWISLIITVFVFSSTIFMFRELSDVLLLKIIIPLWALQCLLWILLLRKQSWTWFPLIVVNTLLYIDALNDMLLRLAYSIMHLGDVSTIKSLTVIICKLIAYGLPFWALLTDRPSMWKTDADETALLEEATE